MLYFNAQLILRGEIWRLVTWMFLPTSGSLLWIFISLSFYYFIGTSIEEYWGTAKFTLFYLASALLMVVFGMVSLLWDPLPIVSSGDLNQILFLAFATLYPDALIRVYMILPVKAKWLAVLYVVLTLYDLLRGGLWAALFALPQLLAVWLVYAVFFWDKIADLLREFGFSVRHQNSAQTIHFKSAVKQQRKKAREQGYRHKCEVCGRTDTDFPGPAVPVLLQVRRLPLLLRGPHLQPHPLHPVTQRPRRPDSSGRWGPSLWHPHLFQHVPAGIQGGDAQRLPHDSPHRVQDAEEIPGAAGAHDPVRRCQAHRLGSHRPQEAVVRGLESHLDLRRLRRFQAAEDAVRMLPHEAPVAVEVIGVPISRVHLLRRQLPAPVVQARREEAVMPAGHPIVPARAILVPANGPPVEAVFGEKDRVLVPAQAQQHGDAVFGHLHMGRPDGLRGAQQVRLLHLSLGPVRRQAVDPRQVAHQQEQAGGQQPQQGQPSAGHGQLGPFFSHGSSSQGSSTVMVRLHSPYSDSQVISTVPP